MKYACSAFSFPRNFLSNKVSTNVHTSNKKRTPHFQIIIQRRKYYYERTIVQLLLGSSAGQGEELREEAKTSSSDARQSDAPPRVRGSISGVGRTPLSSPTAGAGDEHSELAGEFPHQISRPGERSKNNRHFYVLFFSTQNGNKSRGLLF